MLAIKPSLLAQTTAEHQPAAPPPTTDLAGLGNLSLIPLVSLSLLLLLVVRARSLPRAAARRGRAADLSTQS